MEFFDSLVLPQSLEHIQLLKSLSVLTLVILLPYLGALLGSSFLSVIFFNKGKSAENKIFIKFSKELIELMTVNKSSVIGFAVVPMLSFLFLYSQLLQGSGVNIFEVLIFIIIILVVAVILLYIYRSGFGASNPLFNISGIFGTLLLFLSSFLFIGVIQFLNNSNRWDSGISISNILFSTDSLIYFLYYFSASIAITASFVIFRCLSTNYSGGDSYKNYIGKFSLKIVLVFIFIQPILMLVQITTIPDLSLSNSTFILAAVILFVLLLISVISYFMFRENHFTYRSHLLILMFLIFGAMILQSQSSFDTASQLQDKIIETNYASFVDDYKASLGIETKPPISGLDIFKAKCSACHSFENRIVGPPYNKVLPKYENNMSGLEHFIGHPQKIDPNFPSMPDQGLKPDEVKAIATYIMDTYKENKK